MSGGSAHRPLEGMRIIEISSYVATPLSGLTLAQLGADVIRIEPVGGAVDCTRWPLAESGTSLYWSGLNKQPDLSFETLRARRPDLIHVLLGGRRDGGTAVDYTVQAAIGFPLISGPEQRAEPVNSLLPAWDIAAGLYLSAWSRTASGPRFPSGDGRRAVASAALTRARGIS